MKERPIIFSGPMVRAILEGKKTQTRRVVKWPRWVSDLDNAAYQLRAHSAIALFQDGRPIKQYACPYGKPGDRLWVRETWADVNCEAGPAIIYRADHVLSPWTDWCIERGPDYGAGPSMNYEKYPGDYTMWWSDLLAGEPDHGWKPSIFMPRWASRLTLKVTDVRVERLQEISEEDAIAEGVDCECGPLTACGHCAQREFKKLWNEINAKRGFGWDGNPWVWVVTFEVME